MQDISGVVLITTLVMTIGFPDPAPAQNAPAKAVLTAKAVLVVHGGAGTITTENTPESRRQEIEDKLKEALAAGHEILAAGGSSLDAVVSAVSILENSPLFNAGRGAVLTDAGIVELDASIMDGKSLEAGAVASVRYTRNPISLARAVMEQSNHVLLSGDGADNFARHIGMESVPNEYFHTERRVEQFEEYQKRLKEEAEDAGALLEAGKHRKHGTVGAVAVDNDGNLAAATSTGGTSFKKWGRIGDSPIVGAGTYADNQTCAVSATGTGEYFIRGVLAYRVSALMQYSGLSIGQAVESVIHGTLDELGGNGGVIGLDREGNVAMAFNTAGMVRGYVDRDGEMHVAMFGP